MYNILYFLKNKSSKFIFNTTLWVEFREMEIIQDKTIIVTLNK